jgi:hypothetical protein
VSDSHESLGEAVAAFALGSVRALAPEHERPELSLCMVIGRLHAVMLDEIPKRRTVREYVRARARDLLELRVDYALKQRFELRLFTRIYG